MRLISPELTNLIQQSQEAYCTDGDNPTTTKEHYQLSGSTAVYMFKNADIIKERIAKTLWWIPFNVKIHEAYEHGN